MIDGVVFDLDYTLAVPDRDRATLLAAASDAAGAPPLSRAAYVEAHRETDHGTTREPIFERLLAEYESPADADVEDAASGVVPDAATGDADPRGATADDAAARDATARDATVRDVTPGDVAAAYREAVADAMTPVDGAEALVRGLRERYAVGLLTDGPTRAGRSKLRALGWGDLFDAAVVTGEVGADKPDPRGFEAVCERLGVAPGDAVYVGDSPDLDVAGATAAGMPVVQVRFGGGPDPDPRATATVRRDDLATALPGLLADLA